MKKLQFLVLLLIGFGFQAIGQVAICNSNLTVALGADGTAEITPLDLDDGSYNYDSLSASQTLFTCDDIGTNMVTLYAHNGNNTTSCDVEVEVMDLLGPIIQCAPDGYVVALDDAGQGSIEPDDLISGFYSNCQDITITVSPNTFTSADGPEETVTATITDEQGNQTTCNTQVFIGGVPDGDLICHGLVNFMVPSGETAVVTPSDLLAFGPYPSWDLDLFVYDQNDVLIPNNEITDTYWGEDLSVLVIDSATMATCESTISVSDIMLNCYSDSVISLPAFGGEITLDAQHFVYNSGVNFDSIIMAPNTFDCGDLGFNDVVITGYFNGNQYTCATSIEIVDETPPVAICEEVVSVVLAPNGSITIPPSMVDDGSYDNCSGVTLEVVPSVISSNNIPSTIELIATDAAGLSSSCVTDLIVDGGGPITSIACNTDITWTLPPSGSLFMSPEDLLAGGPYFGWDVELTMRVNGQVIPNNELTSAHVGETILCQVTETNYNISCWGNIYVVQSSFLDCNDFFICDDAPWDKEVGDCTTGHTYNDWVEWPSNLEIEACHFSPDFIRDYSSNRFDAAPRLIEQCAATHVSYEDSYSEFGDATIIHRTWTITNEAINESYTYTQNITALAEDCELEVLATDRRQTPISFVEIATGNVTNTDGTTFITATPTQSIITPAYRSTSSMGVDIHDLVQLQAYLAGESTLTPAEIVAADINQDGQIDAADLAQVQEICAGTSSVFSQTDWIFANANKVDDEFAIVNTPIATGDFYGEATHAIGLKPGDINADALSYGEAIDEIAIAPTTLSIRDQLLNNGEQYTVDIYVENISAVAGQQIEITFDSQKFNISDVTSTVLPGFSSDNYTLIDDHTLRIIWLGNEGIFQQGGRDITDETPLVTININCIGNAILSGSLSLSDSHRNTIARFNDPTRHSFRINWIDRIISTTIDPSGLDRRVVLAPNPAQDYVQIQIKNGYGETYAMSVFNCLGQRIEQRDINAEAQVSLESLVSGMYHVVIRGNTGFYSEQTLMINK